MIEEIKLMLGAAAGNYTDAQIGLALKRALAVVEDYCNRDADEVLTLTAERIAVIELLRQGTEGIESQSAGGVSENYLDGYPDDIKMILNRKRKVKFL